MAEQRGAVCEAVFFRQPNNALFIAVVIPSIFRALHVFRNTLWVLAEVINKLNAPEALSGDLWPSPQRQEEQLTDS